jgi:hypothetical protein
MMPSPTLYRILALALAFALGSLPMTVQAARSYQVDLIVFTLQTPESVNSEQLLDAPPRLDPAAMSRAVTPLDLMAKKEIDTNTDQVQPAAATDEKEKNINFDNVIARIKRDPRRKIVLTASWVQPVDDPNSTPVIHITDRVKESEAALNRNASPALYSRPAGISGGSIEQGETLIEQPPLIDGFASFYLSGYYTMELDLRYTPEVSFLDMENPENPEFKTYRIHEKRRMKSDELNYYDHPKFGVLLLVNPAEVAESTD